MTPKEITRYNEVRQEAELELPGHTVLCSSVRIMSDNENESMLFQVPVQNGKTGNPKCVKFVNLQSLLLLVGKVNA